MCEIEFEVFSPAILRQTYEELPLTGPEVKLLWALLGRAAIDYTIPLEKIQKLTTVDPDERWCIEEAVKWVESDCEEPFSFLWVCDHLEICATRLRRGLQGIRGRGERLYMPFTPYDRRD